jgi:hypothetical protein
MYHKNATSLMPSMAASAYLQIGQRAYEQEDWLAAISWLEAAKESATTGGSTEDIHRWAPPGLRSPEDRNKHFLLGIWAGVRNERAPLVPQNGQFNAVMV